ncbi:uncharacterized protein DSM5745_03736 [Aspergillus mulundensis]|uniref:Altered inheritance of mitochondria protein 9, mitochondrial n=1 Tax=Aspergillus mulundensis TaxID=1810919 RepID=A0A3D8SLM0_9EURO|nr:hypothetical protein DSM5745_03736 [Aspergillus mulundensis]RDW87094.1 hypothetical protein DSM5745_03736 [Aspergillus mulundensis]
MPGRPLSRIQCTKIRKCVEGQYNKAYVLTMSNGDEVVARLPNPNAGPEFYTTASEVATRDFVRGILKIPVPRILASSSDATNAVGAEYIIEEKAPGRPLGDIWAQMPTPARLGIIDQLVDVEKKLASVSFPKHGCIYYASDLETRPSSASEMDSVEPFPGFAIGPSNDRKLWQSGRDQMRLGRGPCETHIILLIAHLTSPGTSLLEYAVAIGENELQWAEAHAAPRINPHRSMEEPETPAQYIHLLQQYLKIVPYLVSGLHDSSSRNTLFHPDLHLDNIFIDPATNKITSIIDWQSAATTPFPLQPSHPQMLELSVNPSSDEQRKQEKELLEYYYAKTNAAGLHRAPSGDPSLRVRLNPLTHITGCWERHDTFSLRQSLISVVAHWDTLYPDGTIPCPITFTRGDLQAHKLESELISGLAGIIRQLDEHIPMGGMVRAAQYESARAVSEFFKKEFVELGEDEEKRKLHEAVWPY